MKRILVLFAAVICFVLICPSCKLSLNGTSIPPTMKTIRVDFFENNAALVVNNLSTTLTEALKDRVRNTTRLAIVRSEEADAVMSGSITDYNIAPVSINATANNVAPIAGASRLSITINVKYVDNIDKKNSFEQTFTKTENFTGDIATHEQTLIADLNKQLTEDIFNKAFANW
jgi:Lipopolysaccharide-assembly